MAKAAKKSADVVKLPSGSSRARGPGLKQTKQTTGYRFVDKDPIIDHVLSIWRVSGLSFQEWAWRSGMAEGTLRNWDSGSTKRPQFRSIIRSIYALGYESTFVPYGKAEEEHRIPDTDHYRAEIITWQKENPTKEPRE